MLRRLSFSTQETSKSGDDEQFQSVPSFELGFIYKYLKVKSMLKK